MFQSFVELIESFNEQGSSNPKEEAANFLKTIEVKVDLVYRRCTRYKI